MKKLFVLAMALMMLPVLANAQIMDGNPGFHRGTYTSAYWPAAINMVKGETYCTYPGPINYGWLTPACALDDTFCVTTSDVLGWAQTGGVGEEPDRTDNGECFELGSGYWISTYEVCISVPCDATVGQVNTWTAVMAYCDDALNCVPTSGDCVNPDVYGGLNRYSTINMSITVVESPPALFILQDTVYYVEQGQSAAYVPFSICNGDPCAPATDYGYVITSLGHVGAPISDTGTAEDVVGGLCGDVYGVIDAGGAEVCDYDTLTIIAWDITTGTVYDTCVQVVHIIEPVPVPLFTTPVVTILVLAMILAAAVIMKRTAVSKA